MKKKFMPEHVQYWIQRGHCEEDAKSLAESRKGTRSKGNKKYYLSRGITDDECVAERLAKEWSTEKCSLSKNYILKHRFNGDIDAYLQWKNESCNLSKDYLLKVMSEDEYVEHKRNLGKQLVGKRPTDSEYWISRGYTPDEAVVQIRQHAINSSPRRVEYWINKGYSLEDSISMVSQHQSITSRNSFVARYGEIDGNLKYEQLIYQKQLSSVRSYLHWMKLGYPEEDAKKMVSKLQSEFSQLQPKRKEYWIRIGYSESDAIFKSKEFARKLSMWSVDYWVDKGYSEEDARIKVRDVQRSNSFRGMTSYARRSKIPSSKLQESVIKHLIDAGIEIHTDYVVNDTELKRVYFPDIVMDSCIIEIYGDYWHGNPDLYSVDDIVSRGIRCVDKWQDDEIRVSRIQEITGKPVLIWWESDILKNGIESMLNDVKEIMENVSENS